MTRPGKTPVDSAPPNPIQSTLLKGSLNLSEENDSLESSLPSIFIRKWRLIQFLLLGSVLFAVPNRLHLFNTIPGYDKVSALFGIIPTLLMATAGWLLLREVVTSRRLMMWFVAAISLALAANLLNLVEKVPAWRKFPVVGDEGFLHEIVETFTELSAYFIFFLAFAKSVLTLRAVTGLTQTQSAVLQKEMKLRGELQDGLITERNDARWLAEKLADLNEIAMVLSESTSVYDLCHRAVVVGRCRLGFDRLGIWLLGEVPGHLYGTYGVDETGMTRDERHCVIPFPEHFPAEMEILRSKGPLIRSGRGPLWNDRGVIVGEGDHAVAALWDGNSVVGELAADTLFTGGGFSPASLQLLCVYANVVGHLLAQKRLEESLRHAQQIEERLHVLLSSLHQVTLELAMTETVDDLCRESVRVGKARLGFTRVEIRLNKERFETFSGSYCASENGHIHDISDSTWNTASLDPVCLAATTGARRPISACPLEGPHSDRIVQRQGRYWRNAVPLGAMGRGYGLLIMDHFLPNEALSIADLEIAFLFGEALSHLLHGRFQEEQRRKWADQLAQTQRLESLGTLAGGIAHDFNNILGAMIGFTEMAIAEVPPGSNVREMQEQVLRAGFRAKELVRQILTFSRRTVIGSSEPILPHLIIKEALNLVRASVPSTIRIHTDIQRDCGYVLAEPTHIHQIVMNLCTNAYQAMRDKGDLLEVSLVPVNLPDPSPDLGIPSGEYIRLLVRDNGTGMDYETLQHAFEPFFTTKPAGEGTGLGLSTVQGIASSSGRGASDQQRQRRRNHCRGIPSEMPSP